MAAIPLLFLLLRRWRPNPLQPQINCLPRIGVRPSFPPCPPRSRLHTLPDAASPVSFPATGPAPPLPIRWAPLLQLAPLADTPKLPPPATSPQPQTNSRVISSLAPSPDSRSKEYS